MDFYNFDNFSDEEKNELLLNASNETKQNNFYEQLREKVEKYVKTHPHTKFVNYIMLIPNFFHLICKLFGDTRVPTKNKVYLGAAIVYCISPIDIIPDIIPGGVSDDVIIIIKTLSDLLNSVDEKIILEHWTGEENIVDVITDLSKMVSELFDKETFLIKVSNFFDSKRKK